MRRRQKKSNSGAPKWMVTFSDMVTLILVFFILLFSISQVDSIKFEAISDSFRNRMIFDFYPSPVMMEHPSESPIHHRDGDDSDNFELPKQKSTIEDDSLESLMRDINQFLDERKLNDVISASRTDQGVVLVLQEKILFNSGEAEVLDTAKPFLGKVGTLLGELPNYVKVEGHTDSLPISNFRYPSNWELSGARASSVIRYLTKEIDLVDDRFVAVGYAHTKPTVPNSNHTNLSKNRRVEIIVLEDNTMRELEQ